MSLAVSPAATQALNPARMSPAAGQPAPRATAPSPSSTWGPATNVTLGSDAQTLALKDQIRDKLRANPELLKKAYDALRATLNQFEDQLKRLTNSTMSKSADEQKAMAKRAAKLKELMERLEALQQQPPSAERGKAISALIAEIKALSASGGAAGGSGAGTPGLSDAGGGNAAGGTGGGASLTALSTGGDGIWGSGLSQTCAAAVAKAIGIEPGQTPASTPNSDGGSAAEEGGQNTPADSFMTTFDKLVGDVTKMGQNVQADLKRVEARQSESADDFEKAVDYVLNKAKNELEKDKLAEAIDKKRHGSEGAAGRTRSLTDGGAAIEQGSPQGSGNGEPGSIANLTV